MSYSSLNKKLAAKDTGVPPLKEMSKKIQILVKDLEKWWKSSKKTSPSIWGRTTDVSAKFDDAFDSARALLQHLEDLQMEVQDAD